jgi:hypothetical protein
MHHTCSDVHARAGNHWGAVARTLKSLAYYPFPYRADEAGMAFDRPRRLAVNLLRMVRLKCTDRTGSVRDRPAPATDALQRLRGAGGASSCPSA